MESLFSRVFKRRFCNIYLKILMVKVIKTFFNNKIKLLKIKPFKDNRGYFTETYNKKNYKLADINENFVQDNQSLSISKGTIRGIHFQSPPKQQSKLIVVQKGSIQDIIVDIRKKSKTYGKYVSVIMTDKEFTQLYIPVGFAHGFCTLSNNTVINYKTSNYYSKKHEFCILWKDTDLLIDWKISNNNISISKKDAKGIIFNDFNSPF